MTLKLTVAPALFVCETGCTVITGEEPTAVASFNYHQDHFGRIFAIRTPAGEIAHTACLGFGLERCAMALFRTHGMVPADWPNAVREKLWT